MPRCAGRFATRRRRVTRQLSLAADEARWAGAEAAAAAGLARARDDARRLAGPLERRLADAFASLDAA